MKAQAGQRILYVHILGVGSGSGMGLGVKA